MRLAWASDVHFDFVDDDHVRALCARISDSDVDALLLGGDVAVASTVLDWVARLSRYLARPVHFVLGNHDYYRGSVSEVRARAAALPSPCHWLPARGPTELEPGLGLVGHGGWGDGRVGDFLRSPVLLNDYRLIEELAVARFEREALLPLLRAYGDDAAATLGPHLDQAAARFRRVIVLTHVPPWREACWHEGQLSNDDWAPGFVCGATGARIAAAAAAHPHVQWTVLCGHTHSPGFARLTPNLVAHTIGALYGEPAFAVLDTDDLDAFRAPGA
ncbi:MAG: metallophosphoesterase [Planctomycetota bacterium]